MATTMVMTRAAKRQKTPDCVGGNPALYRDFIKTLDTLVTIQPKCGVLPFVDIVDLAMVLHLDGGVRPHTALWMAAKFTGRAGRVPCAMLMSMATGVTKQQLQDDEVDDLRRIGWNLCPYAIQCGLMV